MIAQAQLLLRTINGTQIVSLCLIMSMFFIPISSTLKSIFLGLTVVTTLSLAPYRRDLGSLYRSPWFLSLLGLFAFALLAMIWSPALWKDKLWVLEKYSKLLYLPILAIAFQAEKTRQHAIAAFFGSMVITVIFSIIKANELFGFYDLFAGAVFRNHIITSMMMTTASYLAALLALKSRAMSIIKRIGYMTLWLLFSFQVLFINGGRMGYLLYLLLMTLLLAQFFSRRQALLAMLFFAALLGFVYSQSPVLQSRIAAAVTDWRGYAHNQKDSSIGYRLQFHQYAHSLWSRHPMIGNGTASFACLYQIDQPVANWQKLLEPHSQYWLIAAEWGNLGMLLYALWLVCLFRACNKLHAMREFGIACLLMFLVGNLSDSLLFYSGSGYFFMIMMALCLGETFSQRSNSLPRDH